MERMYGPATDKITVVKERLEFNQKLINFRHEFRQDIRDDLDSFIKEWKNPYREYSALRFYLALTCFDTLGQTKEFVTFDKWIKGKKYKSEVEQTIENAKQNSDDIVDILKLVHASYNEKYSMQNAFKRFIYKILNDEERKALFHSIKIRKIEILKEAQGKVDTAFIPNEKRKYEFLVSVRNYYTHKSIPTGILYLGNDMYDEDESIDCFPDLKGKLGYNIIRMEKVDSFYYEYSVRGWPKLLISLVKKALEKIEAGESM